MLTNAAGGFLFILKPAEAVLVEGALENAQHDRELKRHVLQEKLRKAAPCQNSVARRLRF